LVIDRKPACDLYTINRQSMARVTYYRKSHPFWMEKLSDDLAFAVIAQPDF